MYLIAKLRGLHRAFPIYHCDQWDLRAISNRSRNHSIVLRLNGEQYLLYGTQDLVEKYPMLDDESLAFLCEDIIGTVNDCILLHHGFVDFTKIQNAIIGMHINVWKKNGQIPLGASEECYNHPFDPKAQELVSFCRVDQSDIIVIRSDVPDENHTSTERPTKRD